MAAPVKTEAPDDLPVGQFAQRIVELVTSRSSYFALDENGNLIPEARDGKRYYAVAEGVYHFKREIDPRRTALIIIDPWEDAGSEFLNDRFRRVTEASILPLTVKAIELGVTVIALTNVPTDEIDYASKVHPELERLAGLGSRP